MTNRYCAYSGNRDEAIVSYLYDDITPLERAAFESHVASCESCREELAGLRDVRHAMADWTPPAFQSALFNQQSAISRRASWLDIPFWAQAAAAVLVLGVAAGAANINVHHDEHGFTVRTGWMRAPEPSAPSPDAQAPWRADLAKLETDMRAELRSTSARTVSAATVVPPPAQSAPVDSAAILRQVKAVVDQSEKRQQNELALRVAQLARDQHAERLVDLNRIDRLMGQMQSNTGFEVARQQQQLQSLVRTVSQTVPVR